MFLALRRTFPIFLVVLAVVVWPIESYSAQLMLTWTDNATNEDGFAVARKTGSTGTFAQIATVGPNLTSYADSAAAAVTTYCYRVAAFNIAGSSAYSSEACGTTQLTFGLAVVEAGTGSGMVTSTPAGITCGTSCSGSYASGTAVTLTAAPAAGSLFTGWSGGGCAGTGPCTVTLIATTTVTATFDVSPSVALTVTRNGDGRWDGDELAGRHHVWDELLGDLWQRDRGDTDRHAGFRLHLHRMERYV